MAAEPLRNLPAEADDDPFRYGWRLQRVRLPNGEEDVVEVPLTVEDLLDPQLGDKVPQGGPHFSVALLLATLLRSHYEGRDDVFVAGDMKMFWGIPGLQEPSPDIAVIPNVRDKRETSRQESFDVVREGTRPCLIIEVVSPKDPEVRRNDTERKVPIYEQAGIAEYLLVEPPRLGSRNRLFWTGYRLGRNGRYQRIEPDSEGRLLSETTQLLFGVGEDGETPRIFDARTGQRLLTLDEQRQAWQAAEERAQAAAAENARLREEIERLRKG
jgi:Uma2 family endonuclease